MAITTQSADELETLAVNETQANSNTVVDFNVGAIPLAMLEAVIAVALFLQQQFVEDEALTRLSTSKGQDKITFGQDFNFTPPAAVAASGNCTFSRSSDTTQALIPVGSSVQTFDNLIQYLVVADTTNDDYDPNLDAYVLAIGELSVDAKVQCTQAGLIGNANANTITVITSSIPGVSSVTNALPFTNGTALPDGQVYDNLFYQYIAGIGNGIVAAIESAALSVAGCTDVTVIENKNYSGGDQDGYLTVTIDDGTGSPSSTLIDNVQNKIFNDARAAGIQFGVFAPITIQATIVAQIVIGANYNSGDMIAAATAALETYFLGDANNGIPPALTLGVSLDWSRLIQIIYDASPGIINVKNVTLNAGTSDISATKQNKIILAASTPITITVTT